MPEANLIKKGEATNFVWGIPTDVRVSGVGRNVNISIRRTSDQEELQDEVGETDGIIFLNKVREGSIEAIIPTASMATLEIANTLSVDGTTYLIMDYEKRWENRGWAKVSINVKVWDAISVS